MLEARIEIELEDGALDAFVACPATPGRKATRTSRIDFGSSTIVPKRAIPASTRCSTNTWLWWQSFAPTPVNRRVPVSESHLSR